MSEPERFDFEAHYFECPICAADVRAADALARGIKAVCAEDAELRPQVIVDVARPGGFWQARWFPALLPSALAAGFACLAAWQGLVVIPSLRWAATPRALTPTVLRAAARGEEQTLSIARGQAVSLLSVDIDSADPGVVLTYELIAPGGATRHRATAQVPPAGSPLIVLLPSAVVRESGAWVLRLSGPQGAELARYPFSVQPN
jgi:hypothetical protein